MDKDVETLGEANEDTEGESTIRARNAQWCLEGKGCLWNVLGVASAHKVDVHYQDGDPGEKTEHGNHVHKVAEHNLGIVRDVQVCEQGKHGGKCKGVDRDTAAVGSGKYSGSFAFTSQTIDGSGCNVEIGVGGREDENKDTSVEDGWKNLDSGDLDSHDEWRCTGAVGRLVCKEEVWVVVWHDHSEEENAKTVEEENSVEGKLDSTGNRLSRVLSFTDSYTNQLSSEISEGSLNHS